MVTSMTVFSPWASAEELPLAVDGAPSSDPIQIRNIVGLEPVKANVNTTPYGSVRGESFNGTSVGKRNIVLTLGLNPDWADYTFSSLRQILYGYFMPEQEVTLRFYQSSGVTVDITGVVESLAPNAWTKDPEAQISVICPEPDFVAVTSSSISGTVSDETTDIEIINGGNVSSGFTLKVESSVTTPSYTGLITILNKSPFPETLGIVTTVDAGDFLHVSTIKGQKAVHSITTGGVITNLLRTLTYFKRFGAL